MARFIFSGFLILALSSIAISQSKMDWSDLKFKNDSTEQSQEYQITLTDGTIMYGQLQRLTSNVLYVDTGEFGVLSFAIEKIQSIHLRGEDPQKFDRDMVGVNHYLIAPSPFSLEQNEFNLQLSEIFFLSGWFGITDNFTIGGGFTLFPGIDLKEQLFYIIPKVSVDLAPGITASAQLTQVHLDGEGTSLLSVTTGFGKPDSHISFGYSTSLSDNVGGAINIGTILRLTNKFGILGDGYFFTTESDANLFAFGGRFIGKSSSFDFGFVGVPDSEIGAIPWFNYTVRF